MEPSSSATRAETSPVVVSEYDRATHKVDEKPSSSMPRVVSVCFRSGTVTCRSGSERSSTVTTRCDRPSVNRRAFGVSVEKLRAVSRNAPQTGGSRWFAARGHDERRAAGYGGPRNIWLSCGRRPRRRGSARPRRAPSRPGSQAFQPAGRRSQLQEGRFGRYADRHRPPD